MYKYPAKYIFTNGVVVLFTKNRTGTVVTTGGSVFDALGEFKGTWIGPEGNRNWVLVPEVSTRHKLHEAVSKLNYSS